MKDLDSYLNDHLAGSISALELIAHWVEVHKGEPLGSFFVETEREIKADQDTLRDVMRTLGVEESKVRQAGAWAAEKVGRARLMIAGDEQGSLGLVLTLEGLIMGVTGKKLMWRALAAAKLPRLKSYNFEELQRRAEQQIERLEAERISAVRQAFAEAIGSTVIVSSMGARGTNTRNGKAIEPGVAADSAEAAEEAGLQYVNDERPGYSRRAKGKDFEYLDTEGKTIRDEQRLLRIKRLAIPPAWTEVWICPSPNGHIQATGRDARGRKQYRYHERWREVRDENKFDRLAQFAKALPNIRRRVARDLKLPGLPRQKVLATIVRLLERTPYYMIKDRLARAEADSVRELKPGEGMIIGRRGKKVAAFRDPNGNIHRLSPVCTHLGCLVRWNPAESTWDCPCHGSRFKPTGEVIAGPAEEPLPPI